MILLVDDEEKIMRALSRALRQAGHEVIETASARQAERLLAERPFDLLLIDNVMPERSLITHSEVEPCGLISSASTNSVCALVSSCSSGW